jgi:hypothetical protein
MLLAGTLLVADASVLRLAGAEAASVRATPGA